MKRFFPKCKSKCVHCLRKATNLLFRFGIVVVGFAALVWFLIRVIPKPSRAAYPCQRAAFPLASAFVLYLMGLVAAGRKLYMARRHTASFRIFEAGLAAMAGFGILFFTINLNPSTNKASAPPPANNPIGTARGIFPGRVVWIHDPNATFWDPAWNSRTDIYYWDENHTNSQVVESMLSDALCTLTNQSSCDLAWDSLFRHFNIQNQKGDVGYQTGEKVVIKVNHNNQREYSDVTNEWADTPPCLYVSLLAQLVYDAGVPENCITLTDSIRCIDDKTYAACTAVFPNVRYVDYDGLGNRISSNDIPNQIHWSGINEETGKSIESFPIAESHMEADYIINLGRLQGHNFAGVSFMAKNWYGSFGISPNTALHDMVRSPYHENSGYQLLVDLMGHPNLGGKTVLYLMDGLWGFEKNGRTDNPPTRYDYAPFNQDYPSSLFVSQDPVAIDSVAYDFYSAQYPVPDMQYLHEAALADNPPSGTFYDPDNDGNPTESLGAHEHWNNAVDKLYSRNLGTGDGIELISADPSSLSVPDLPGDFDGDGIVGMQDLNRITLAWNSIPGQAHWDPDCDIAPAGGDEVINNLDFTLLSQNWNSVPE